MFRRCVCIAPAVMLVGLSSAHAADSTLTLTLAAISHEREQRRHWRHVRELIDQEADVDTVSWKLRLAILKDAKLDVSKVPTK